MVFQDSLLFNNMTVQENILFGCPHKAGEHRDRIVNNLSEAYGIVDLLNNNSNDNSSRNTDRKNYGTGSYPPCDSGLHRRILHVANRLPFAAPCFWIASSAYCEHVGRNRQQAGCRGDRTAR